MKRKRKQPEPTLDERKDRIKGWLGTREDYLAVWASEAPRPVLKLTPAGEPLTRQPSLFGGADDA